MDEGPTFLFNILASVTRRSVFLTEAALVICLDSQFSEAGCDVK
jgi:hypothetical protein